MATKYLEIPTSLEADQCAEWLGRKLAVDTAKPYPIPCDRWIGPPANPPPESLTRYAVARYVMQGGGAVFECDDNAQRFARGTTRLTDGTNYTRDAAVDSQPAVALTARAQTALQPSAPLTSTATAEAAKE